MNRSNSLKQKQHPARQNSNKKKGKEKQSVTTFQNRYNTNRHFEKLMNVNLLILNTKCK